MHQEINARRSLDDAQSGFKLRVKEVCKKKIREHKFLLVLPLGCSSLDHPLKNFSKQIKIFHEGWGYYQISFKGVSINFHNSQRRINPEILKGQPNYPRGSMQWHAETDVHVDMIIIINGDIWFGKNKSFWGHTISHSQ